MANHWGVSKPRPLVEEFMRFPDRSTAGRQLVDQLGRYANQEDAVVLALPPGGVPVGFEIARALAAPLDIMVVRRLEVPNRPELAMGVVSADGGLALNYELIRWLNISDATIDEVVASESLECSRLDKAYRGDAPRLDLAGKVIIVVDDGIVIASAMRGAIAILRLRRPKRLVIAAPVASAPSVLDLQTQVDDVVACATLNEFEPVDRCYEDVAEISEESVREFYERAMRRVQVAQKTLVTQHTMRSWRGSSLGKRRHRSARTNFGRGVRTAKSRRGVSRISRSL